MMVFALAFYLFAILVVVSGIMVVLARNPVHSVLWLILAFFSAAGLFVLMGAEFVAMLLVIVYVGAVAVLFLFVVMMLDVDFAALKGEMAKYFPLAGLIAIVMLLMLGMGIGTWHVADGAEMMRTAVTPEGVHNTKALGLLIYDQYLYLFLSSSLILLVAMIGAILLTLRHRTDVKRQNVMEQMHRDPAKQLKMLDVKPGQGL
ncbi:NADH:ubiquinone oxidoreductase subunit J [Thioclava sp. SK-1]|uniref:NADH-quinone oxidoreductase subunit J n=1 Tax=Thioclava sp. SK-1 TaxID=1889770 RepID=UPI000825826C|nr:NADH-quinone oxidoreductase subunit J [Thioclava sp. SK-1]OCX61132.1 NADH:ubiquinone oxidoreductase subunit J [Thioclava sp. SK-1]